MHYLRKLLISFLFLSFGWAGLQGQETQPTPPQPCSSAEYRQFDFWIGHWEVQDAQGKVQGHNQIHRIEDACGLEEHWTSATGNQGTSYNFYDAARKVWHQTWVDSNGGALFLEGKFSEGSMSLSGVRPGQDGAEVLHRIRWTPLDDGRVEQHWQFSNDEGKTWSDAFKGYYRKKT